MALPVLATDAALPAADTGSDPYRVDAEGGYAVSLADLDGETGPVSGYAALPPAATVADYVLDPDARVSKEQHDRALAPETRRSPAAPATSTVFRQRAAAGGFRGPGAHVRAGAARGCQARGRSGRSRADTKPPFKNDGEH